MRFATKRKLLASALYQIRTRFEHGFSLCNEVLLQVNAMLVLSVVFIFGSNAQYRAEYGTDIDTYNNLNSATFAICSCYEDDVFFDDWLGTVQVMGRTKTEAQNHALNLCNGTFGHTLRGGALEGFSDEIIIKNCTLHENITPRNGNYYLGVTRVGR